MRIRNGSIELHVADDGDPWAPPMLLLHGIASFGGKWEWIVPDHRVRNVLTRNPSSSSSTTRPGPAGGEPVMDHNERKEAVIRQIYARMF